MKFMLTLLFFSFTAFAHNVLEELPGCYQVDYSYAEIEALKEGYQLDNRVYDATKKGNVYELFFPMIQENKKLHFQRVLFTRQSDGSVSGMMKHYAEVLSKNEDFFYAFAGNNTYNPIALNGAQWVREVRYLDDGPSYACTGKWGAFGVDEFFECSSFASIPGRETRDMGRRDYNTMERFTKLIFSSWGILERQNNVKTIMNNEGVKIPLAKELGKVFSIKVSDDLCAEANTWATERKDFWLLSIETWNEYLDGSSAKKVYVRNNNGLRFSKLWRLAEKYVGKNLGRSNIRTQAKNEIKMVLDQFVE